ncbi:hypothetical protein OH773_00560 [Buttiauxella sp. WJP83]|uniref:hypothetical protein n=1 Tax=Buttiauxella sp. WJP83 TaxID=2986951 RepID=UPI0022DE1F77|nr:hypothetical protein [Buttiauxella sp. WJP83]WBM70796.1 hypothetical protein OH773_00560 [Buttiauxella sp. WJP83]
MKYLFLLLLACGHQVFAVDKPHDFNPADPGIWQEKPKPDVVREKEQQDELCQTFPNAACPTKGDNQTDIQREQQRREDKRRNRLHEEGD